MGCRWSEVQILSPRPKRLKGLTVKAVSPFFVCVRRLWAKVDGVCLNSPQRHEPLQMMILIPKLMIDHHEPLRVMRERQLPRHADAAVQLDAFLRDPRADPADAVLRGRHRALARDAFAI